MAKLSVDGAEFWLSGESSEDGTTGKLAVRLSRAARASEVVWGNVSAVLGERDLSDAASRNGRKNVWK